MSKLNKILMRWLPQDVHSLGWLVQQGLGPSYAQSWAWHYYKKGLFDKIGPGIYKRAQDIPHWLAVVRLLQYELGKNLHISGRTALELHGAAHFVPLGTRPKILLLTYDKKCKLPKWVHNTGAQCQLILRLSSLFEPDFILAHKNKLLQKYEEANALQALYSCRELAVLEFFQDGRLMYEFDFEDAESYLANLIGLRSEVLQLLLENCTSIKIKRAFLYLSDKLNQGYLKRLDLSRIDLGKGSRQIAKGHVKFNKKYKITVPIPYDVYDKKSVF